MAASIAKLVGPVSHVDEDRQHVRTAIVLLPVNTSGNQRIEGEHVRKTLKYAHLRDAAHGLVSQSPDTSKIYGLKVVDQNSCIAKDYCISGWTLEIRHRPSY